MPIRPYQGTLPRIDPSAYIDEAAIVIGDVTVGPESSLWPTVVARGDVNSIRIGARSNIQDGAVLHVTHPHEAVPGGHSLVIGDEVTVGHRAVLHGCTIANRCLIGMGAIVLDGARLEEGVLLGAGSVVGPGKVLEGGHLWLGSPARCVRPLSTKEMAGFEYSARHYLRLCREYRPGPVI